MRLRALVALATAGGIRPAMRKVANMDSAWESANQLGIVLKDWTPAEMDKFARDEGATWSKLIRDNNITMAE